MSEATRFEIEFDRMLGDQPLMGVFRNLSPREAVRRASRAWDLGVRNVEIPVQSSDAMPSLRAVIEAARERGLVVGAGTIVTTDQLADVVAAGAAYTVSPGLDVEIVEASVVRGVPHLPGVATASEIVAARKLGLRWVKAFPASIVGAAWVGAMLGPFPEQKFVVTGGMNASEAPLYLKAGARCVAIGADFEDSRKRDLIEEVMRVTA